MLSPQILTYSRFPTCCIYLHLTKRLCINRGGEEEEENKGGVTEERKAGEQGAEREGII